MGRKAKKAPEGKSHNSMTASEGKSHSSASATAEDAALVADPRWVPIEIPPMTAKRPVVGARAQRPPRYWVDELLADSMWAPHVDAPIRAAIANAVATQCLPWFLELQRVRDLMYDFNARHSQWVLRAVSEVRQKIEDIEDAIMDLKRDHITLREEIAAVRKATEEAERVTAAACDSAIKDLKRDQDKLREEIAAVEKAVEAAKRLKTARSDSSVRALSVDHMIARARGTAARARSPNPGIFTPRLLEPGLVLITPPDSVRGGGCAKGDLRVTGR